MKKKRFVLMMAIIIFLLPTVVLATNGEEQFLPISIALFMEAFVSIHMSVFVLKPLADLFAKAGESKKIFWILFLIRAVFLIIMNFVTTFVALVDFFGVFVGAMIVVPIATLIKGPYRVRNVGAVLSNVVTGSSLYNASPSVKNICPNCKADVSNGGKYCSNCGAVLLEDNNLAATSAETKTTIQLANKVKCSKCGYEMATGNVRCVKCGTAIAQEDAITSEVEVYDATKGHPVNKMEYEEYLTNVSEAKSLKSMIEKELIKIDNYKLATLPVIEKRKNILTFIYTVIIFIVTSIFFLYHSSSLNYINIIGVIITIIYVVIYKNYNLVSYLFKEIKSRPDEKISYIISSVLSGTTNNAKRGNVLRIAFIVGVLAVQVGIYYKPHLIFERYNEGYAVRYYTYGIFKKDKELVIPSHYKGEQVISIRGDVFENSNTLEKITLPETIKEIRGGAFKNCRNLLTINIPSKITEIRGNTFEGCSNMYEIVIPEGVTRIGGSAFRNCTNLTKVTIPRTVSEIGSSAFRNTRIEKVCISASTYVNERAFKETYPSVGYYERGCGEKDDDWNNEDDYYYGK